MPNRLLVTVMAIVAGLFLGVVLTVPLMWLAGPLEGQRRFARPAPVETSPALDLSALNKLDGVQIAAVSPDNVKATARTSNISLEVAYRRVLNDRVGELGSYAHALWKLGLTDITQQLGFVTHDRPGSIQHFVVGGHNGLNLLTPKTVCVTITPQLTGDPRIGNRLAGGDIPTSWSRDPDTWRRVSLYHEVWGHCLHQELTRGATRQVVAKAWQLTGGLLGHFDAAKKASMTKVRREARADVMTAFMLLRRGEKPVTVERLSRLRALRVAIGLKVGGSPDLGHFTSMSLDAVLRDWRQKQVFRRRVRRAGPRELHAMAGRYIEPAVAAIRSATFDDGTRDHLREYHDTASLDTLLDRFGLHERSRRKIVRAYETWRGGLRCFPQTDDVMRCSPEHASATWWSLKAELVRGT